MTHSLALMAYTGANAAVPYYPGQEYFSVGLTDVAYIAEHYQIRLLEYVPARPVPSTVSYSADPVMSGGENIATTYRNVTESCRVRIIVDTAYYPNTNLIVTTVIRRLQEMFRRAEHWQRYQMGTPVYLHFRPGMTTNIRVVRSEILSGQVALSPDFLGGEWVSAQAELVLTWTRRYFWEDTTPQQICVSQTIKNYPGYNGYEIDGTSLLGDLPSPLLVNMVYTKLTNPALSIWCGVMWFGDTDYYSNFEAEDFGYSQHGTIVTVTPSPNIGVSAGVSGNAAHVEMSQDDLRFALSTSVRGAYRCLVRVLAGTRAHAWSYYHDFGMRCRILSGASVSDANAISLFDGEIVYPAISGANELIDLGSLVIPPNPTLPPTANLFLSIQMGDALGSGDHLDIDYIMLLPADSFTRWIVTAPGITTDDVLIDLDKSCFQKLAAGTLQPAVRRLGTSVLLYPHQDDLSSATYKPNYTLFKSRIVFVWETSLGAEFFNSTYASFSLSLYYWPRWLAVPETQVPVP